MITINLFVDKFNNKLIGVFFVVNNDAFTLTQYSLKQPSMRKINQHLLLAALTAIFVLTTSSMPAPQVAKPGKSTLSSKEIYQLVETQTGKELSLKEKIAIKLFNKKINNLVDEKAPAGGDKSQTVAWLLALFLGGLGIHRFYLGYTWQGVVQLLTAGGCGIWALIDFIRILTGSLQPKDGSYASKDL